MNLIEEAVILDVFGIRMYAFGTYVALGALFAVIVLILLGNTLGLKKGTAALTAILAMLCGGVCSRLVFCLLNQELGRMTPVSFWFQISGGGWSMFGLIGGAFLGGWLSAKMTRQKTGKVLDVLSVAVLPMIAAERIGESRIEDFDISRPLDNELLRHSFLAVGEDDPCLATYFVAAAAAIILFIVLAVVARKRLKDGTVAISFLIVFGAASIVLESLRYDRFLSISFVGLQQIAAAVMLALGIAIAIRRSDRPKSGMAAAAVLSLLFMAGMVIFLEFRLDRSTWNKLMIYAGMILTVSVPAVLGLLLLRNSKKRNAESIGSF